MLGNYGNIQKEGETKASSQTLRNKNTYSVILASFSNKAQRNVTLFQVRWFSNGELKRAFGISRIPLYIEKDFSNFDAKGLWKKRIEQTYNGEVKFFDGPGAYANKLVTDLGLRSIKALSLFNQVVGVKVLEDLDEFIRTNMLEEQDAETEFIQLRESFLTLMDAKTNIEKAKEQIFQLTPINEIAMKLNQIQADLKQLNNSKEVGVYWFAKKSIELAERELLKCKEHLTELEDGLTELRDKENSLKQDERTLSISIERDEVGSKIKDLEKEIKSFEGLRKSRAEKLDQYNKIAQSIELGINPSEETFKTNRETANAQKFELEEERNRKNENLRQIQNKCDDLKTKIESGIETIKALQKNKNNIAGKEAEIRDEILEHISATKEEIPFIGELIKVKEDERQWELSAEKILHNFALRLIVPEKYYTKVNEYVNRTNLKGRITYQRYKGFTSLAAMTSKNISQNSLINKLEFKPKSIYID